MTRLISVTDWNRYHVWPTVSALRQMAYKNKNGFRERVIRQPTRRLLIDEKAFFEWIEEQGTKKLEASP